MRDRALAGLLISLLVGAVILSHITIAWGDHGIGPGISDSPDSIAADTSRFEYSCGSGMYSWQDCDPGDPQFTLWEHSSSPDIQMDIDLLISDTFADSGVTFTQTQIDSMLEVLYDTTNVLGTGEPDIDIFITYFNIDTLGYDENGGRAHFEIFHDCDTMALSQRNHIDAYACHKPDVIWGTIPSPLTSPREDPPRDPCVPFIEEPEMHQNSLVFQVPGNTVSLWKHRWAASIVHEFSHILRRSNQWEVRDVMVDEIFSSGSVYMCRFPPKPPTSDVRYNLSVFVYGSDPPSHHYKHRNAFAGYLLKRYKNEDLEDQVMYRWIREDFGDDHVHVTKCALAKALEDPVFASLGGSGPSRGSYRMGRLHSDWAVAMWLDDDGLSPIYDFGDDYSPALDAGFFVDSPNPELCWEDCTVPEHVVGSEADSTWIDIPGPEWCWTSAAENDCADPDSSWCEPIAVKSWGGNWIVFRTDTDYYDETKQRDLRVRVRWPDMRDDYRIWLRVIEYPTERDSLFLYGDEALRVRTGHFNASVDSVEFWVPNLTEGHTEAMVLVVTMVDTLLDNPCNTQHPVRAMTYSYSYAMFETPAGGCPFVSVWGGESYHEENNVLAGLMGPDAAGRDCYILQCRPSVAEGTVSLRLTEDEGEVSYFDRVAVATASTEPGSDVAASVEGGLVSYHDVQEPLAAYSAGGVDVTERLLYVDDWAVRVGPEHPLTVTLPLPTRRIPPGGGMVVNGKPSQKLEQPFARAPGPSGAIDLGPLTCRVNSDTWFIAMPDDVERSRDSATVLVTSPIDYYLDFLAIAESDEEEPDLVTCDFLAAEHNTTGGVFEALVDQDGNYAILAPGQQIDLLFREPSPACDENCKFVLITEGYFESRGVLDGNEEVQGLPSHYALSPNYPNPFTPPTTIRYEVPAPGGPVRISVYNLRGQHVRTLVDGHRGPGRHSVLWDGTGEQGEAVSSGVYFYRIVATGFEEERKMIVLK
jgi:hypothetical protein